MPVFERKVETRPWYYRLPADMEGAIAAPSDMGSVITAPSDMESDVGRCHKAKSLPTISPPRREAALTPHTA
jgi:hypothetical protein